MAFKVSAVPGFEGCLAEALDFMNNCDPSGKAAARLLGDIEGAMHLLAEFPRMCHVREEESKLSGIEMRATSVGNYLMFYAVRDDEEEVRLYTIRHKLADPEKTNWAAFAGE